MTEIFSSKDRITPSSPVCDYLRSKHQEVIHDYKDASGRYSQSCGLIAVDLARLLLAQGAIPSILVISQEVEENGSICPKRLSPLIFEGRVSWYAHQVCCCDNLIYDPILEAPIPTELYTQAVFGEVIPVRKLIPEEEIRRFVSRR